MCNSKICVRVTPPERSVKRKKEKGRCLILFGQKSERSEKRKTQEKEKKEEKKRKKAKRVVQTPSPSLEKGRLSPFQFYFFIVNNYTCVCLLCCLRERERERERESQIRATLVVEDTRARLPQQQRIDRSRNTRYIAHRYLLTS